MRKNVVRTVALLGALMLFTTGCLTIRQFSFSKTNLDISSDDITSMRLRIKPDSATSATDGYGFVLVGLDEELTSLNRKEWQDIDGDYGVAAAAITDGNLLSHLLAEGECDLPGGADAEDLEASYNTWKAFRTNAIIDQSDIDASSRLNFVHNLGIAGAADANDVAQVVAISGIWADDGDLVPEAGEAICSSAVFTSVTFKD